VLGNPWCPGCQTTIRRELGELGDLAAILNAFADGHRPVPMGERVAGTPGRRSPSPSADLTAELDSVLRSTAELYSVLHDWECAVWHTRFGRDAPPSRRGYLADRLTTCVVWLIDHFDGIITHPDIAADFGTEIRDWYRSLRGRTKAGTSVRHKPLRCPGHGCGQLSLTWREGDEYVRCVNRDCGQLITLADYEDMEVRAAAIPAA
jgi:hypothetical protein